MDVLSKSTGDSYTAAEFNQSNNELENVITSAGITLSSGDLFQIGKALANYSANGDYYTDSGAADAYVLGVIGSKQAPTAYVDGLRVRFVVGNTNTGASTVNVASLGVKNIFLDGVALVAGALVATSIIELRYDNSNSRFEMRVLQAASTSAPGPVELATTAEVKTGTDPVRVPSVASMVGHEGIVKGWIELDGTGTISILASYNVSSIVDNGVGDYTINWDVDFASANYVVCGTCGNTGTNTGGVIVPRVLATGSLDISTTDVAGASADFDTICILAIGSQ